MFRKTSIIGLLAALLVLIGIFFAVKYSGSEDRTFRSKVLDFKPELITGMQVTDYQSGQEVKITSEGDDWTLLSDGKEYSGGIEGIGNAIGLLSKLNTVSIVATRSGKWEKYHVDEHKAIRVRLYEGEREAGDLFIGKFDFEQIPAASPGQQPQTSMTSYVRPAGEDKVYAVNGILRSNFQGGINPFRNRILLLLDDHLSVEKINLSGPEEKLQLSQENGKWFLNGSPADSALTDRYLRSLTHLRSHNFIDNVDVSSMQASHVAEIEGAAFGKVIMHAYPAQDSAVGYYVTSSLNPGSVFNGMKGKAFEKIFAGAEKFLGDK